MKSIQKIPKVICKSCGESFQQWVGDPKRSHWRRLFCSRKCQYAYATKGFDFLKSCEFCGKEIKIRKTLRTRGWKGISPPTSRFCSRPCTLRFYNQNRRGKQLAEGHRNKISEKMKGRTVTWGHKISIAITGPKHWNWKGGISIKNHAERSCIELKEWRRSVFKRDKYACVVCGYRGKGLEVDHIKSWSRYPELRFEVSNGRTLCKECHSKTPNYRGKKPCV